MIILGLDPGSIKTGWAVIEALGNKGGYIDSGTIKTSSKVIILSVFLL